MVLFFVFILSIVFFQISLFSVLVSFVALMTLSIILFGTSLFSAISGASYAIAFIMPLIGYGSGYLLAYCFGLPDASKRTVGKITFNNCFIDFPKSLANFY